MNLFAEFWKILTHPSEYSPIITLMAVFFGMVLFVSTIALVGWRATYTWGRTRPRLNLAATGSAILLSLLGLTSLNAEFYLEVDQARRSINFKWLFLFPAILSAFALRRWLAAHHGDRTSVSPDRTSVRPSQLQ